MKESISALMDDEANEIEIQRLLSKSDSKDLLDTWKRYHNARDVMSGMSGRSTDVDISSKVAAAIRGEAQSYSSVEQPRPAATLVSANIIEDANAKAGTTSASKTWKFGGAIAACLVVAFGFSGLGDRGVSDEAAQIAAAGDETIAENLLVMNDLDESQVSSFNQYLLRHSELSTVTVASGVAPLIRVASVNSVGI
jgi:sigma-E factor negative regulatory protein RseA